MVTDNSPMPFGKYKGKPLIEVPAPYFLWLLKEGITDGDIKAYITANLDVLKKEAARVKR